MKVFKNSITGKYLVTILQIINDIEKTYTMEYYDVSNVEHARKYGIGEEELPDYYIEVDYLTELRKQKLKRIKCTSK